MRMSKAEQSVFNKILLLVFIVAFAWGLLYALTLLLHLTIGITIVLLVLITGLSVFSAIYSAKRIAGPLMRLSEVMKKSSQDEQVYLFEEKTNDEMGVVITAYNDMAKSINDKNLEMSALYQELYASEETLKNQYDELLENRNQIEVSEKRYASLFELTSEGLFDLDANHKMIYYSLEWYKKIGVDTLKTDLKEWTKFIVQEDQGEFQSRLDEHIINRKEVYFSEYRIKDRTGKIHWINAMAKANFDSSGRFTSMSGVHRDITRIKEHEEAILIMAYTDSLTRLPNRLKFEELANNLISKTTTFGLLYIDIDNFKYINDTYGHQLGDQVIQSMGKRLEKIVNEKDTVSRLSGDEFGIISKTHTTREELEEYTRYILDKLSIPYSIGNLTLAFTASIGIAMYPKDGETFNELLVCADVALYEAKDSTKNTFQFFEEPLRVKSLEKAIIESHLLKSLELEEIYVMYQPIMDVRKQYIKGFEALARWKDAELGSIYPDVFIPIAEKTGFIHQLGDFVLDKAIAFAKELQTIYGTSYMMNVNVSAVQLHSGTFIETVQGLLVHYQLPAECLNLEITESVSLDIDNKVIGRLAEISKKGINISLDDFGTGYSSLNNLINLSINQIKIDRSLILQSTTLKEVHKLIRGVVEFAHALDLTVVAEGIETKMMEDLISEIHIDFTQGYYYSKPLLESEIIDFIKTDASSMRPSRH